MTSRPVDPPPLLNIANVLTGIRLLLVPVFLYALLAEDGRDTGWRLAAFGVFAVASFTDSLDGDLARRRGLVTAFGTIADPIADKALTGSALVGLSLLGLLPWWVTLVILGRELGVTALRLAGTEPLALDRAWLPLELAEPLLDADFTHTSLYDQLAIRCGVRPTGSTEQVRAVVPNRGERVLLNVPPGVALLAVERTGCLHGRPVEHRHTLVRGDRFAITAELTGKQVALSAAAGHRT